MPEKIFEEIMSWKGKKYKGQLFKAAAYSGTEPVTQIQAVCFSSANTICFYKNVEGWWGNPGGTIDQGESISDALARELDEEASLQMDDFRIIGYERFVLEEDPSNVKIFLRAVAKVTLLDKPISDPSHKAVGRQEFPLSEAGTGLDWGERGEMLIAMATEKYREIWGI